MYNTVYKTPSVYSIWIDLLGQHQATKWDRVEQLRLSYVHVVSRPKTESWCHERMLGKSRITYD